MAITSTRLCRAVCFCVVSFASGFLCFFLLFGCSLGGFVLPDAAWARSELAVFCFLALVVCLASLRPLKKSSVQKKKTPSSTITPPSSTITLTKKYQVFLSFRGEDTRVGFTSHLYDALSRTCMLTFIDYKLVRGEGISPALLKSIQESMIAVVIFSKDYASSRWCLRELAEIMKLEKLRELIVLPVFYNVDPSDVRKQTGPFKDSFAKHENDSPKEVLEWREAFTEASNLAGWDYDGTRSEAELVRDIVEDVQWKLMSKYISPLSDFEGLIGIHKRIEQVMPLLCLDTMDVRSIGIWGMGGIGKTTLAEVVFNQISGQFDGSCFIEEVGERLENRESNCLRLEVLSKVLHEVNMELATPTILHPFIRQRLTQKKVLIVFDAVNKFSRPLETLVNDLIRCGLGSRIIITSRDKQVLYNYKVLDCNIYEVEGLNFYEALMLFSNYAFNQNHPTEDFIDLSVQIVRYAKGNPLALRVLGSHLLGKDKQEWESAFVDLQGIGGSKIFNVLKLSYDHLDDKEKNLFLDIACFFDSYYYEHNIAKLIDCKYSWGVLVDKSLITIKGGGIRMHDLVREMGREIVRRESPKNPGKRSRLWKPDDVIWTLQNNKGTEGVEGIYLERDNYLKVVHLNLSCQVFDKMPNLRLLSITYYDFDLEVHLSDGCLNSLPDDLIILKWYGFPSRALPSNFSPKKLVQLDLSFSNIEQLWEGTKRAPKLKELTLRYCERLTRIPNLSDFLSLEHLDLLGCHSLVEFPSSVQQLNKLRYLSLGGCSNVTKFPLTSASIERLNLSKTAIEEVPSSIQSLTNLTKLDLSRCTRLKHIPTCICDLTSLEDLDLSNCSKLGKLPDNLGNLKSLKKLIVRGTAIGQLPSSIRYLENLEELNCSECRGLTILPPLLGLRSLSKLYLNKCNLMEIPEDIGCLSSLKELELRGNMFERLPKSIKHLSKLQTLFLTNCNMLRSLTELPVALKTLEAFNCKQLCQGLPDASEFERCISKYHKAANNIFEQYHKAVNEGFAKFSICLPGTEIPEWFTFQSSGSSVYIQVLRQDLVNRKLMGFAICVVLGFEGYYKWHHFLQVQVNCHFETCDAKIGFLLYKYYQSLHDVLINSDHILLGYSSISKLLSNEDIEMLIASVNGDYVDISLEFEVKFQGSEENYCAQCAVYPIYAESKGGHKGGLPRVIAGGSFL